MKTKMEVAFLCEDMTYYTEVHEIPHEMGHNTYETSVIEWFETQLFKPEYKKVLIACFFAEV